MSQERPRHILPVLVFSQFAGTSLWFAGNAVLSRMEGGGGAAAALLAVQLGFIVGTLVYGTLNLPDRFPPRAVFMISALAGAVANLATAAALGSAPALWAARFVTGFFLAGVYPVGMKIAASWYREGLGRAQGYLVGALAVGSAFPHLLGSLDAHLAPGAVFAAVSALASFGGVLLFATVPLGPVLPKAAPFDPRAFFEAWHSREFRGAVLGYFGHMWELYAFWGFVPALLAAYARTHALALNVPFASFVVIMLGSVGCVVGGLLSVRWGSARVAFFQLLVSGTCCLFSPVAFGLPAAAFFVFLGTWGSMVSGDSPQFTSMGATFAPRQYVGSSLALMTSLGFAITLASIELLSGLRPEWGERWMFLALAPGPTLGILAGVRSLGGLKALKSRKLR